MAGIRINFAEVSGGFDPVPEGTYEVIIEKVEVRDSKSSDNDYLNWEFRITDEEYEGQRLWNITSLSPKALFRLKEDLLTLGVIEEDEEVELEWEEDVDITQSEGPRLLFPEVEGLACCVQVRNEVWEGKERNKVAAVLEAGSAEGPSASDEDAPKTRRTAQRSAGASGRRPRRRLR